MIICQLSKHQFDRLHASLIAKARAEPFDASYTISIKIGAEEYAVKLQPERHYKMAVLQALRIRRDESGHDFELITRGALLSSFLEILIHQGVG